MGVRVPFTRRYIDNSTSAGYQFEFRCDRCSTGYRSAFEPASGRIGGQMAETAGSLLSGFVPFAGRIGDAAGDVSRLASGPAHDAALERAINQMRPYFAQCPRCASWVCRQTCWNPQFNLCATCAPKAQQEAIAAQARAQAQQARAQALATPPAPSAALTPPQTPPTPRGPAVASVSLGTRCSRCKQETHGGRFCPQCGMQQTAVTQCSRCTAAIPGGSNYCLQCGQPQ